MTPDEWDNANDPLQMLRFLRDSGRLTQRKARLFCVAVCRGIWHLLADERSKRGVVTAEVYADGLATAGELELAREAACDAGWESTVGAEREVFWAASWAADGAAAEDAAEAADAVAFDVNFAAQRRVNREAFGAEEQAALLRDIFDPFNTATLNPSCLSPSVVALATTIYDERSFERLPELARALADAGCTDAGLLAHLHSPGPHMRGCFALDLVLGKA